MTKTIPLGFGSWRPEPRDGHRAEPGPERAPAGYDPRAFPAFAVTVDVVILTLRDGTLQVLLVERGEEPFQGRWAVPGGFKRPTETLDEAAGP